MALRLLSDRSPRPVQNLATELESLFYTFLFSATADRLHWKHSILGSYAFAMKYASMANADEFELKLIKRIYLHPLRQVARELRSLFFKGTDLPAQVDRQQFLQVLSKSVGLDESGSDQ